MEPPPAAEPRCGAAAGLPPPPPSLPPSALPGAASPRACGAFSHALYLFLLIAGGFPPQPVVPTHKDKSGAPPVRSIYDELSSLGRTSMPLASRRPTSFTLTQSRLVGTTPSAPGTASSMSSPASIGQPRKTTLSPAQRDPFYTSDDSLTSEDQLDDTWVTVFGFPQASASYILLQFAQYGNIQKHVMSNAGNWMHIRYQSKLQAQKALSKDGKIFGESLMIGVKPCVDKSVMKNFERSSTSSMSSVFTPPPKSVSTPVQPANDTTSISTVRLLAIGYKASTSDCQVVSGRQTPRKDGSEGLFLVRHLNRPGSLAGTRQDRQPPAPGARDGVIGGNGPFLTPLRQGPSRPPPVAAPAAARRSPPSPQPPGHPDPREPAQLQGHGEEGRSGGAGLRPPSPRGARRRLPTLPRLLTAPPARPGPAPGACGRGSARPAWQGRGGCGESERNRGWSRLWRCLRDPHPQP
ncbi:nucleoporin NUP35-like [Nyctibius grandis]|uniref:nucleoporin NUP35-like n=1 Tax=Nyctibius grandis TaxID=48427 RepID=UPI0035BBA040